MTGHYTKVYVCCHQTNLKKQKPRPLVAQTAFNLAVKLRMTLANYLIPLPLFAELLSHACGMLSCMMLGIKSKASCTPGKYATN